MSARRAAVTLAIESAPPHGVIFIERAEHLRHHAGEIAFPGGAAELHDNGELARTALRELEEEVGIEPERVSLVGQLSDVSPRVSGYVVTPFVAVVRPGPYILDRSEVAGIFTVPLAEVVGRGVGQGRVKVGIFNVQSYIFEYGGSRVWGMTARVLQEFVTVWKHQNSELRTRIEQALERPAEDP
jgi:ADP-ribose pyrophosphatase YjhB (NUDIX family)